MKNTGLISLLLLLTFLNSACESPPPAANSPSSDRTTPTPERLARVEEKFDPSDVIEADISDPGPTLLVSEETDRKDLKCDRYNRVMINSSDNKISITGACNQILVNGHRNRVTAAGAVEIIAYGSENTVEYSKYVNGKRPMITDTSGTNTISRSKAPSTNTAK